LIGDNAYRVGETQFSRMKILLSLIATAVVALPHHSTDTAWHRQEAELMRMVANGQQKTAEDKVSKALSQSPENLDLQFMGAVLERSRFAVSKATDGFFFAMKRGGNSPEALASACILGIDASRNQRSALYYFNALQLLARQNPDSISIHWMAAVMARTLTNETRFGLNPELWKRILYCGIREYGAVLALMAPGIGPAQVHQTMANMLDQAEAYDASIEHRKIAVGLERAPWSLQAMANTLLALDRADEALPLAREAISLQKKANYFYTLGCVLNRLGQTEGAIDAWEESFKLGYRDSSSLKACIYAARNLGDYVLAREFTRKALSADPKSRTLNILDARFGALLGDEGAGDRVIKAGEFDSRGNPVDAGHHSSDPWFAAVERGDFKKARQLMGATDVNAPDGASSNQTALMVAASNGWELIVADLLRSGAKLDLVDANGDTALHYSAQYSQPRTMKLLLDAGARTDLLDKWSQTPLIMCASSYNWEGFQMLMAKNVDVNAVTPSGVTALHVAAGYGELGMVKALLARGAKVNAASTKKGETPLMNACSQWPHPYIITPLITAGADINARDKTGKTALHHAISATLDVPLVEVLLRNGADPTLADNGGMTAITKARRLGFEDVAGMMEKKTGIKEPVPFPKLDPPAANLSADESNARLFILPILLAQGNFSGKADSFPPAKKIPASNELSGVFGISNADEFKEEIGSLEKFEPAHRDDAGNLPSGISVAVRNELLKRAVEKIRSPEDGGKFDDSAWTGARIIYLTELGMSAGYLPKEEGDKLIASTSKDLGNRFTSWEGFLQSFIQGAKFHEGWEASRYENITRLIQGSEIAWPKPA